MRIPILVVLALAGAALLFAPTAKADGYVSVGYGGPVTYGGGYYNGYPVSYGSPCGCTTYYPSYYQPAYYQPTYYRPAYYAPTYYRPTLSIGLNYGWGGNRSWGHGRWGGGGGHFAGRRR